MPPFDLDETDWEVSRCPSSSIDHPSRQLDELGAALRIHNVGRDAIREDSAGKRLRNAPQGSTSIPP